MIGTINDPRVATAVGGIFGGAAADIRARVSESVEAEEVGGERATAETSYTDEFVRQLRVLIDRRLQEVIGQLHEAGADVRINFHPTNFPVGEENQYGADIGIRTILRSSDSIIVKGALFQCKRMYGPARQPHFQELRGRGEKQAKDMLRVTPSSFFILYNFGSQQQLLEWSHIPTATICPMDGSYPIGINRIPHAAYAGKLQPDVCAGRFDTWPDAPRTVPWPTAEHTTGWVATLRIAAAMPRSTPAMAP